MKHILLIFAVVACKSTTYNPDKLFVNTLGMKFVTMPGTEVAFCIWESRVKDYAVCAAAIAGVDASWKNPRYSTISFTQTDTHSVVMVSWEDAQAFCTWLDEEGAGSGQAEGGAALPIADGCGMERGGGLGKRDGQHSPNEKAEGIKGDYPWGKEWPPPKEAGNYDGRLKVDNFDYTSPVGSFAANQFGIHDLGGNVWEWCEDKLTPTSSTRVSRGASWVNYSSGGLLSSYRRPYDPGLRGNGRGFQCVLMGE